MLASDLRTRWFFPCTVLVLAGATAAATLGATPIQTDSASPAVTTWQFASIKVQADAPNHELGRQVLKMGRDAWELVSVENFIKDGTTTHTAFYFKRPL